MEQTGGNTNLQFTMPKERVSQSKYWCFTHNNYDEGDMEIWEQAFQRMGASFIFQEEIGAPEEENAGTPHLQGYYETPNKSRWSELKLPFKPHFEKRKGTKMQNIKYCSKEYTHIGTRRHYSRDFKPPRPLKLLREEQLRGWQKEILAIIDEEPDDRTIHWYWSAEGNVGKTTFTKYLVAKRGATLLAGKGADVRNGVIQHVQENEGIPPEVVVFPVPRSFDTQYLSYEALENVKDMCFYSGKYEGGSVCGNCPHLIVFANVPPDEQRCSADRWRVVNIDS